MTTDLTTLDDLERAIIIGQRALITRNRLLVELANSGHTGASLCQRLNAVRAEEQASPLTPDAVYIAIRRNRDAVLSK